MLQHVSTDVLCNEVWLFALHRSHSTVPQQMSIGGVSSSSAENLLSDSGNGSEKECGSRRDSLSSVPSNQSQMNGS